MVNKIKKKLPRKLVIKKSQFRYLNTELIIKLIIISKDEGSWKK